MIETNLQWKKMPEIANARPLVWSLSAELTKGFKKHDPDRGREI